MIRMLSFGVFDGLHEGHKHFLREAGKLGDELIVIVARDSMVKKMKKKLPRWNEQVRMEKIRQYDASIRVVPGDKLHGTYSAIKIYQPHIICLGYDQNELEHDLEQKMQSGVLPFMRLVLLKPNKPELYKSSLMA